MNDKEVDKLIENAIGEKPLYKVEGGYLTLKVGKLKFGANVYMKSAKMEIYNGIMNHLFIVSKMTVVKEEEYTLASSKIASVKDLDVKDTDCVVFIDLENCTPAPDNIDVDNLYIVVSTLRVLKTCKKLTLFVQEVRRLGGRIFYIETQSNKKDATDCIIVREITRLRDRYPTLPIHITTKDHFADTCCDIFTYVTTSWYICELEEWSYERV